MDPWTYPYEHAGVAARAIDAEHDARELSRIASEQIQLDVDQWRNVDDLIAFVRGPS